MRTKAARADCANQPGLDGSAHSRHRSASAGIRAAMVRRAASERANREVTDWTGRQRPPSACSAYTRGTAESVAPDALAYVVAFGHRGEDSDWRLTSLCTRQLLNASSTERWDVIVQRSKRQAQAEGESRQSDHPNAWTRARAKAKSSSQADGMRAAAATSPAPGASANAPRSVRYGRVERARVRASGR